MNKSTSKEHQEEPQKKRKLVTLTISDKLKVIEKLENGVSIKTVSELFGISKGQVSDIRQQKTVIRAYASLVDNDHIKMTKRITKKRSKEFRLDSALYTWYMKQRSNDISVQSEDFLAAAEKLKKQLGVTGLVCNESWLTRYKERHNIKENDIGTTESVEQSLLTRTDNSFSAHEENVLKHCAAESDENAMNYLDIFVKQEEESREGDYQAIPTASEGDATTDQQDDEDELLSPEKLALEAALKGIDDVIKYVGYTSNRGLWAQYEQLRVVRELIIEDRKRIDT